MKEIQEFKNISLEKINTSNINDDSIDGNDIDDIVADIKEKGLSRPIIVSLENDEYTLILGVKRFLAARKVKSNSIFCGVINGPADKSEVVAIALCYTSLEDMLNNEDKALAIKYLNENFEGDLNKISSISNLDIEEINSFLNFGRDIEKVKKYLNNNYSKEKLSSFSPKEVSDLVKLLDKLN